MANKEKEKRDSMTSNPIKREKKHFITERKKREKENKSKALDNDASSDRDNARKRMAMHGANRDDNAIKSES